MSVLPASASKSLAVGGVKKNVTGSTSSSSSVTLVPGLVSTSSGLTIQSSSTPSPAANKTRSNQQPSISITPLPRTTSASTAATAAPPAASNKPSLSVSPVTPTAASAGNTATPLAAKPGQPTTAGQKGSAICEICDGYIKVSRDYLLPIGHFCLAVAFEHRIWSSCVIICNGSTRSRSTRK